MLRARDFYSKSNLTYRLAADLSPWRFISARSGSITDRARLTVEAALLDHIGKNPAYVLNLQAALGFRVLGAEARPALPVLIKIYKQNLSLDSRLTTCAAIMAIGPAAAAAVPALLRGTDDPNELVRAAAIGTLWHIHPEPSLVLPVFTKSLADPKFEVREVAAWALAGLGAKAEPATPALVPLLNDPSEGVRVAATNALRAISLNAASAPARNEWASRGKLKTSSMF
jgi:HEAT repeat protein